MQILEPIDSHDPRNALCSGGMNVWQSLEKQGFAGANVPTGPLSELNSPRRSDRRCAVTPPVLWARTPDRRIYRMK